MTQGGLARADVVAFDEPLAAEGDVAMLLGGKGAGLVEMTQKLRLPVPPGFVITTEVCRRYLAGGWPAGLDARIDIHLDRLAAATGRRFGGPGHPLLVSVRSGAPVSMPGMMDTLLNVGITPESRAWLAAETGDATFAADTWLRFCRMYAEIVLDLPKGDVASAAASDGSANGKLAAAERVERLAADLAHPGIPREPREQLRSAVEAVFRSWNSDRAKVFRAREGVSEELGTAVTVQAMVFGNLNDRSGTGVVFTRDPATGERRLFGDYLPRAQGEDVVAGTHAVSGLEALHSHLPDVHAELLAVLDRLERHYRDVCDVEFTVSQGTLYVLQTRIGRRSPLAAVRIAVDMAEDAAFPLSKAEAVARIDADILARLAGAAHIDPLATPLATGRPASPGVGVGVLCCDPDRAAELSGSGVRVVLAREETSPSDVHGMVGAAALLTTTGGVASHAAVVARGWGIPAVTGAAEVAVSDAGITIGGVFIPEGETVTVDGTSGAIFRGDQRTGGTVEIPEVQKIRQWAADLGVDPGGTAGPSGSGFQARAVSLVEVARTVQLKGLCTADKAAAALATSEATIEAAIESSAAFFKATVRGHALTPEGRAWLNEALGAERAAAHAVAADDCYTAFMVLNASFKQLVSEWQVAGAAGHPTPEQTVAMLGALREIHTGLAPVLGAADAQLARLSTYGRRFDAALASLQAGDLSMLASPLKDSYHTVWFEYHEELIALCGRDRLEEERAGN
jgi:pyruvate,orthophosphate dikinase